MKKSHPCPSSAWFTDVPNIKNVFFTRKSSNISNWITFRSLKPAYRRIMPAILCPQDKATSKHPQSNNCPYISRWFSSHSHGVLNHHHWVGCALMLVAFSEFSTLERALPRSKKIRPEIPSRDLVDQGGRHGREVRPLNACVWACLLILACLLGSPHSKSVRYEPI